MEIAALDCPCQRITEKPKILEIRDSAINGCQYCQTLWDCISQFSQVEVEDQTKLVIDSYLDFINGYIQVHWEGFPVEYFQLSTVEDVDHGWNAVIRRNPIAPPGSLAALVKIRSWIEECTTTHPLCGHRGGVVSQTPKLPRRVLKISSKKRNGTYTVSLYESPGEISRYTALSHCWGEKQPLATTRSTLPSRITGIEWSSLPRTFQQAIDITYSLDVQYIWIDSLCIVQDDKEDWARESAAMGAIYENSWVTIAAAAAPDGTHGCLPAPPEQHEYLIQMTPESEKSMIYAQHFPSPRDDKDHIMFIDAALPLFQRAWVLQERLLAPRILQLCEREMVWDCTTNVSCECSGPYEDRMSRKEHGVSYGGIKYRYNSILRPQNRLHSRNAVMEFWDHVLYHYLRRNLTFPSDRLPALSGLVEKFQETGVGGRYLAGLWEKWLPQGLLWFIDLSGDPCPEGPPDKTTTPSWSWASVHGPWRYCRLPLDTPATSKLLEARCSLASSDPRGMVLGGRIMLSGPITSASIDFAPGDPAEVYQTRFRKQKVELIKGDLKANTRMDFVLDSEPSPLSPGDTVRCIQIQLDFDLPASFGIPRHCHGLILRPSKIDGSAYERVGTFLASQKWFHGTPVETISIV